MNTNPYKPKELKVPIAEIIGQHGRVLTVKEFEKEYRDRKPRPMACCPGCKTILQFKRSFTRIQNGRRVQVSAHFAHQTSETSCETIEHIIAKLVLRESHRPKQPIQWECSSCEWPHRLEYNVDNASEEYRIETDKNHRSADVFFHGTTEDGAPINVAIEVTVTHETKRDKWKEYENQGIFGIEYKITEKLTVKSFSNQHDLEAAKEEMKKILDGVKPEVKSSPKHYCPPRTHCEACGCHNDIHKRLVLMKSGCGESYAKVERTWGSRKPRYASIKEHDTENLRIAKKILELAGVKTEHPNGGCPTCGNAKSEEQVKVLGFERNEEEGCPKCNPPLVYHKGKHVEAYLQSLPKSTQERIIAYLEKGDKIHLLLKQTSTEIDTILTHAAQSLKMELCRKWTTQLTIGKLKPDEETAFNILKKEGIAKQIYLEEGWEFKDQFPEMYHHETNKVATVDIRRNKAYEVEVNGETVDPKNIYFKCVEIARRQGARGAQINLEARLENLKELLRDLSISVDSQPARKSTIRIWRNRQKDVMFQIGSGKEMEIGKLKESVLEVGISHADIQISHSEKEAEEDWVTRNYQQIWEPTYVIVTTKKVRRAIFETKLTVDDKFHIEVEGTTIVKDTPQTAVTTILDANTESLNIICEISESGKNTGCEELEKILNGKFPITKTNSTKQLEKQRQEIEEAKEQQTILERKERLRIETERIREAEITKKREFLRVVETKDGMIEKKIGDYIYKADDKCVPGCPNKLGRCTLEKSQKCRQREFMEQFYKTHKGRPKEFKLVCKGMNIGWKKDS